MLKSSAPPPNHAQSDLPPAAEWITAFVPHDEDIKIIYPHLTLRSRHRGPYIPDPTRCARYTSLTCLFCQTLVYRIHRAVLLDDELNIREGPIITKGWAETEALRSASGWLEVCNDVLAGEKAVTQQKNLPQYSELFELVLFTTSAPPSPDPSLTPEPETPSQVQSVPKYHLPPIPAIFPEPKSTRSLFAILAAIATRQSNAMRSEAEEYIDGIVKEKVAEIKRAEILLKRNVQILLNAYSEGIKKAEQDQYTLGDRSQGGSNVNPRNDVPSPPASPTTPRFAGTPSSVVRDFLPMIISPSPPSAITTASRRSSRPSSSMSASLPRVSALSASLATSSFHHPKAAEITPSRRTRSPDTDSLRSLQSASTTTLTAPHEHNHVFQFSRTFNDNVNTAASYRYFQFQEEMEKREKEKTKKPSSLQEGTETGTRVIRHNNVPSTLASTAKAANGKGKVREEEQRPDSTSQDLDVPLSPTAKGKRKVTFDVQVNPPANPEGDATTSTDSGDMMFDLEEETDGEGRDMVSALEGYSINEMVLPLVEPPSASQQPTSSRPRPTKRTSSGSGGVGSLPASFSTLRPTSLPAPSHMPIPVSFQDTTTVPSTPEPRSNDSTSTITNHANANSVSSSTLALDQKRNDNILNLLAARLPSHRAAWAGRNEKEVYETFVRGTGSVLDENDDEELDPDDDVEAERMQRDLSLAGIPSSVPIGIHRPSSNKSKPPLSLASYQPDAVLTGNMTNSNHESSSSSQRHHLSSREIRRAAYAERDVRRGIDPGALDYVSTLGVPREEDEFDSVSPDTEGGDRSRRSASTSASKGVNGVGPGAGRSGRDRAQRILESQARSGVPDDGMWRSLV